LGVEQFKDLPRLFINDLKEKDEKFTRTIKYLLKKLPENCKEEERRRAKESLSQFLACLTNLDGYHQAQFDSLFSWLVGKGRFAEIYSFRKLVEADLNVIPNLKIKTNDKVYELDALIPITKDTVIRCESTLSETLDKEKIDNFKEIENIILKEMGLMCKTLVIGRECLRSSASSDADFKMLSFSELSNKPKVISTLLSLI
jgi:SPX domain protein involved in polyphosphate accumulation